MMTAQEFLKFQALSKKLGVNEFPDHLYPPKDVSTLDIENTVVVNPTSNFTLLTFTCPKDAFTRIIAFAVFNDGLAAADFDFVPTIDNRRVFPYHGDPTDNFRIYMGVTSDIGNEALRYAMTDFQAGQTFTMLAINRGLIATTMSARIVGYVSSKGGRAQNTYGG